MNDQERLILDILQEEAAELIMICSKIKRFGMDSGWDGKSNKEKLVQEMGDVLALITMLNPLYDIQDADILDAVNNKAEKLKVFAPSLFKPEK